MPTQNPRLADFAPLLGEWTTTGKHPYLPGRTLRGRASFESIEGVSRRYAFEFREGALVWWRDDPAFRQRFTVTLHLGENRLSGKGEMSRDGAAWEGDLEVEYERATTADSSG